MSDDTNIADADRQLRDHHTATLMKMEFGDHDGYVSRERAREIAKTAWSMALMFGMQIGQIMGKPKQPWWKRLWGRVRRAG